MKPLVGRLTWTPKFSGPKRLSSLHSSFRRSTYAVGMTCDFQHPTNVAKCSELEREPGLYFVVLLGFLPAGGILERLDARWFAVKNRVCREKSINLYER